MSEIAKATGINVTSTHAVLNALIERGYLSKDEALKTYTLGPTLITVGRAAVHNQTLLAIAREYGEQVRSELGTSLLINTVIDDEIVTVYSSPDLEARAAPMQVGQRLPMVPPVGASFIAWSGLDAVDAWIARGPTSADQNDLASWRQDVALIHERGYQLVMRTSDHSGSRRPAAAFDRGDPLAASRRADPTTARADQLTSQPRLIVADHLYDVHFISAPIFDGLGVAVFNIGIGGFPGQLAGHQITAHAERLMATCLDVMRLDRAQNWR